MDRAIRIIVFARSPVHAGVKRRLAAAVGDAAALAVHRKLLRLTLRAAAGAAATDPALEPVLWHLGAAPLADIPASFWGPCVPQPSEIMAENLAAAVAAPSLDGVHGVVVVGTDHPEIAAEHIAAVARLLRDAEVAVGPAEDGGFWALGTTVPLDDVVRGLPLGASSAGAALLAALAARGLAWKAGPALWDVDEARDLARWKKNISMRNR